MPLTTEEKLKEIIADQLGCGESDITPSSSFLVDFDADSLDKIEIIMLVEEEFEIRIDDDEADNTTLFSDLLKLVVEKSPKLA